MGKEKKNVIKKQMIEIIKENRVIIEIIGGLLALTYPLINFMYNLFYQIDCEKFYGIPGKYFHSSVDNRLLYVGGIIFLIFICAMPAIIKKSEEKKDTNKSWTIGYVSFLAIIIGMEVGLLNVYNLIAIMKQTYMTNSTFRNINTFLDSNPVTTIIVIIMLGSLVLLGITLINEIVVIKCKLLRYLIFALFGISFIVSLLLMIYGTIFKMSIGIEDKIKYEFATIEGDNYVVLTEYENKVLVTRYAISQNREYIFDTSQYYFFDKNQGIYWYTNLDNSPEIQN